MLSAKIRGADLIVIPTTLYDCMQNYWVDFRYQIAVRTINQIKKSLNDATIVVCGSHATVRPDLVLQDTLADVLLLGEYEKCLCMLTKALENKKSLAQVPNLVVRTGSEVVFTPYNEPCFHPESEENVFPDYSGIDFNRYYHDDYVNNRHVKRKRWGTVLAARGCPGNCLFCYNFFGRDVRIRSPKTVVDELEFLQEEARLDGVYFIDSTFGLDANWVLELCDRIKKKGLTIPWNVESRCDLLPLSILREMKSANCNRVWVGVESFDDDILTAVRKGYGEMTIETFLNNAKKADIEVGAFINFGLPKETLRSLNHTLAKLQEWELTYTKSIIIGSPKYGTDYCTMAMKQYPFVGESFSDINAISGLVGNEIKPHILKDVVNLMYDREFIYGNKRPCITNGGIKHGRRPVCRGLKQLTKQGNYDGGKTI